MTGHVITNFTKDEIAVLITCNDNLCRATTRLSIDNTGIYLSYRLMKAKIFILSHNAEIKKYQLQQIDIGILFRPSIWVHLIISSFLLHLKPLETNEWHFDLRLNLLSYEWSVNKLLNSLYKSTFQHCEVFWYFGL
jgi:hypothetical protein